jgi:RNA polymerase sigma factor (sigma-70 family)
VTLDPEELVRRASQGDVHAFVDLTMRYQHHAFGSALALLRDFQKAEDVVQEAFLGAWSGLPTLADPAAFPGWLRGIVRHHAFRVLRRRQLETLPLTEADEIPSDDPSADLQIQQRQQVAAALAAIAALPILLREPATLFYLHECSQQDIATFLGLSITKVNNRLHAARQHLKEKMLTMDPETLAKNGLPDDFANRIGRLVETRGSVVEALFDPGSLPDILTELAVSDEAQRRAIAVQVIQRPGGGIVRCVATSPMEALPRGATVLSSGCPTETPVDRLAFDQIVPLLAGSTPDATRESKQLETGIKVIDVMCPLTAGGSAAIAGEIKTGIMVVTEELVRRLSGGTEKMSLFSLIPPWHHTTPGWSLVEELKKDGFSEGTVGAVQTFFFRSGDGPWTADRLTALAPTDAVIHLSRTMMDQKIYPAVDVLTCRSRLVETKAVGHEHAAVVERVRHAIEGLRSAEGQPSTGRDAVLLDRARKLQYFFAQPFFVAEAYTKRQGARVSLAEALRGCREILDGMHDDLSVEAFYFKGGIADITGSAQASGAG